MTPIDRRSVVLASALGALLGPAARAANAPLKVVYPNLEERPIASYGYQVLELALKKSGVPFSLAVAAAPVSAQRAIAQLETGEVDVLDSSSSIDAARRFALLPFPLDLGVSGCRLLIGRKDTVARIREVRNIRELAAYTFGQGPGWIDTQILRNAGLQVVEGEYRSLFRMLEAGRFDLYPLGAEEAFDLLQLNRAEAPDARILSTFAIFYPFVRVFYVTRGNEALRRALTIGLTIASADGSLQAVLAQGRGLGPILAGQRHLPRTLLTIPNPWLPPAVHGISLERFYPALRPALRQLHFTD